jgi:protein-S-isoprenylcysteine O-methyltransferase Ste14
LIRRWLASTSNRTFVAWPIALLAVEAAIHQGLPDIHWWAVRSSRGATCNTSSWAPSGRAKAAGTRDLEAAGAHRLGRPYRWTRNPMYLGHLIFLAGLALALGSWIGALVFAAHAVWFDRRVREDEARLAQRFGDSYVQYCRRVNRWIPGIY